MKKEITLGQLLSVAVSILIAVVTGWITLNNKVSRHDTQIESLYQDKALVLKWMEKFDEKIEKIIVGLENKKNRD